MAAVVLFVWLLLWLLLFYYGFHHTLLSSQALISETLCTVATDTEVTSMNLGTSSENPFCSPLT